MWDAQKNTAILLITTMANFKCRNDNEVDKANMPETTGNPIVILNIFKNKYT
jgi:hypothetical protein